MKCSYCGDERPETEMVRRKLVYRGQGWQPARFGKQKWGQVVKTDYRWYCKDKGCGGYDQMAHEG